ncbi:4'-phosphopantetheinyl transferase [Geosmithia morbida]|uniref:holo-[acyl-carrier-protein] synthase n=1 Tax=Geosmithia morbida TaxID=1094350 RepID=A0A9P5D5P6_9HYPO|nr:4'-phosphopantetheinyl transferase [Geosmithia morbida]KAF4124771.1 4'-phosphopantetheinyl transferase [Geosmithia morbida]
MALGSHLLKRYAVCLLADVSWDEVALTRGHDTKPIYRAGDGSEPVSFNVSHQAGLVVLVASASASPVKQQQNGDEEKEKKADLGVDIVCPSERRLRDRELIRSQGWSAFVDMHADVLCPDEVAVLHSMAGDEDRLLRYFYALWCLREAYVKMTGEALLAPWLPELEMRWFCPPEEQEGEEGGDGGRGRNLEIWFRGGRVVDVHVRLVDYMDEYMICTAVRGGDLHIGEYDVVDVRDVIAFAERSKGW